MKLNDSIRESPREQADEEIRVVSRTLIVDTPTERINSPPPRPQSQSSMALNSDMRIPVPTPTPTPGDLGKDNIDCDNSFNTKETDSVPERISRNQIQKGSGNESQPAPITRSSSFHKSNQEAKIFKSCYQTQIENCSESQSTPMPKSSSFYIPIKSRNSKEEEKENVPNDDNHHQGVLQNEVRNDTNVCDCEQREDANDQKQTKSSKEECNDSLKKCRFMLDNMSSKMEDEDIIIDPIKMLQGEGESLKDSEENGRDHFDEGFHSGELVASEEDSNTVEALRHTDVKDEEEFLKPIRVSTPMPRSSSFYKSPESKVF